MTDGMKQKMADMAYKEAERLRWMNVRGLMEIAYGLASLSASWYHNNVWHDVGEDVGDNSLILVLDEEGRGCTTTREQLVRGYGEWGKGFCRWAYVEDLMPDIKEGTCSSMCSSDAKYQLFIETGEVLTEAERMVFHMINDHVYNHDSITEEEVHAWMTENFMPVLRKELDIKTED